MKAHDPEQVLGEKNLKISWTPIFGEFLKFKRTIRAEWPVTMQSSNTGARAANEANARWRRGPADGRRSVHPGGGGPKAPSAKKNAKSFVFYFKLEIW